MERGGDSDAPASGVSYGQAKAGLATGAASRYDLAKVKKPRKRVQACGVCFLFSTDHGNMGSAILSCRDVLEVGFPLGGIIQKLRFMRGA